MRKILKSNVYIALVYFLLTGISCSKGDGRTWEQERAELDAMIKKLEAEGIDVDTTENKVYYITYYEGEGATPQLGDTCSVEYRGYANNIKVEDSHDIHPNGRWNFIYKPKHKVAGFVEGIGYMNEGAEIEMFIPSDLAYGAAGTADIPPYTTLIYRATMHELKIRK